MLGRSNVTENASYYYCERNRGLVNHTLESPATSLSIVVFGKDSPFARSQVFNASQFSVASTAEHLFFMMRVGGELGHKSFNICDA